MSRRRVRANGANTYQNRMAAPSTEVSRDVTEQALRDRIQQLEDEQVQWGNKLLEALGWHAAPEAISLDKILEEVTRLRVLVRTGRTE